MQLEGHVSPEQVLQAAEQLSVDDLERLVAQILTLRAERTVPHLGATETELLLAINEGWPAAVQQRFEELVHKRQAPRIAADELDELVRLSEQSEQRDARRLAALTELARVRGVTLPEVMHTLGLGPTYA